MATIGTGRDDPRRWVKAAYQLIDAMERGETGPQGQRCRGWLQRRDVCRGRVVGFDTGGIASFNFIVGTASCETNNRYVVEPGGYDVLVPLSISDIGARDPDRLLVQDCFVRVT